MKCDWSVLQLNYKFAILLADYDYPIKFITNKCGLIYILFICINREMENHFCHSQQYASGGNINLSCNKMNGQQNGYLLASLK